MHIYFKKWISIKKLKFVNFQQVRKQTPKVAKADRQKKKVKGRSYKRLIFKRRFANVVMGPGQKKKSPNWNAGRKDVKA